MQRTTKSVVTGLTLLALGGCGLFGSSEPEPPPPGCPPVHALIGADRVSSYLTAEQRIDDLRFVAAINDVRSRCRSDGETLVVDLAFELVAERGPALEPGSLELDYFVATLAPGDQLIAKQLFPAELDFGPDGIAGFTEILTLELAGLDPRAPPTRRLLVGFALEGARPPALPQPVAEPPAEP